ncbi:tetratricopeptide repeat protein [uncultured Rubinisphaera sp.]|uniref:tetratricopeptide repeat protein n=1 Tax=uncultured Rubinisphaera sp. TaxID=1678686 RepID=UPI0030D810A8
MKKEISAPVRYVKLSRRKLRLALLILLLIGLAGGYYWLRTQRPQQLIEQASLLAASDPEQAEQLLAYAIQLSGNSHSEAQLFRIALLIRLGNADEALGQFTLIEQPETLPQESILQLVQAANQRGMFYLSENLLLAAVSQETERLRVLRSLLEVQLIQGKAEAAIQTSKQILEEDPEDATAWRILGTYYLPQKKHVEAEEAFRNALKYSRIPQQRQSIFKQLIAVLIDQGLAGQARTELEQYREQFPSANDITLQEASIYRLEGQAAKGLELMNDYIARRETAEEAAHHVRGLLLIDLNQNEQAAQDLELVVNAQPWNYEAHYKLALAYRRLDQEEISSHHQQLADKYRLLRIELLEMTNKLREHPDDIPVRNRVAELYETFGNREQAKELRRKPE